jgi:proteasome alpha subunit
MLGMKALYTSTEGKIDASTLELGVVTLDDRQFRKLSEEEVGAYVSKIREELKGTEEEEKKDDSESQEESTE